MCPRAFEPARSTAGSALLLVLYLVTAVAVIASSTFAVGQAFATASRERAHAQRLDDAAEGAVQVMLDRLAVQAALRLGDLSQADLSALGAALGDVPMPPGVELDPAASGFYAVAVRHSRPDGWLRMPHDERPLARWTHQPRAAYVAVAPVGGRVQSRRMEITLHATVADVRGGRRSAQQTVAVAQLPPYQEALYTRGTAELCASAGHRQVIGGPLRADGEIHLLSCGGSLLYVGGVEARDAVRAAGATPRHWIAGDDGVRPIATVSREAVETTPTLLDGWAGRLRVAAGAGGALGTGALQDAQIAGSGECPDGCGGNSRFSPSLEVQRIAADGAGEYRVVCGIAFRGAPCAAAVRPALRYHPWPFAAPPPAGMAAESPARPGYLWKGLFPDPRREGRCTARLGSATWRTFRCPSNAFGYVLDVSRLPALPGGVLSVRRMEPRGAGVGSAAEVVLLTHARALAGPLTLVSELPVFVQGDFNTVPQTVFGGPPPALIQAPRITILPAESAAQLRTSAVWDSVAPHGESAPRALPLQALSGVTVFAVLRAGYCRTLGGAYFGGSWEALPAVLGDWSGVGLRIVGAVVGDDETARGSAHCSHHGAPWNAPQPGGTGPRQPLSRTLQFDDRLLDPRFQPPGSWRAENTPDPGWPGTSRTRVRQRAAWGGTTVLQLVRPLRSGRIDPPRAAPIPPLPSLPPAAAAWPAAADPGF